MPEILRKAYIDPEVEDSERAIAVFEAEAIPLPRAQRGQEEDDEDEEKETKVVIEEPTLARQLFETGYKDLKSKNPKNERLVLLEVWKIFEQNNGSDVKKVQGTMLTFTKKQARWSKTDSDEDRETPSERIQRPGGGGNDGDASSSEDEHED